MGIGIALNHTLSVKDKNLEVEFHQSVLPNSVHYGAVGGTWVGLWSKMSEMLAEVGTKELIGMYSLNLVWEPTEKTGMKVWNGVLFPA